MIVGGPHDGPAGEALSRSIPRERRIDLTAAQFDPLVIQACLKRARLYIGGASLWTHMAAAAGAPTLALYGPTDEAIEGPWGPNARIVRGPRTFEAIKAQDPKLNQPVCHMLDLPADAVLEAAARLLADTEPTTMTRRRHG
ncbi:MAG: glycosyltransferase family 9 protein [Caulobacteraceae bacterium]